MKELINNNAKNKYNYKRYVVDEVTDEILTSILLKNKVKKYNYGGSKYANSTIVRKLKKYKVGMYSYLDIAMSFDIETYTDQQKELATMYVWQLGLNGTVIIGRKWPELIKLLTQIKNLLKCGKRTRVICFVHNLAYEFQFMRNWLKFDNVYENFFKEQRQPVFITHDNWLMFRDSMAMTNSSLKKLASDYTNTQKCVGDLDYTIARNYTTPLTDEELSYCDNDVLILNEFFDYFKNTYLSNGFLPLTISGVIRKDIKDNAELQYGEMYDAYLSWLSTCKPANINEYKVFVNYVYRGGYTHANKRFVGKILTEEANIYGYDFTSSYPASMLLCYYPTGKMHRFKHITLDQLVKLCKDYCVQFKATFYNIKATTNHSIESVNKLIDYSNIVKDNGRVAEADSITVALTELDFATYKEFYAWESVDIHYGFWQKRGYLPDYVLKTTMKYYNDKAVKKQAGISYVEEKAKVNTTYGVMVTRMVEETVRFDGEFYTEPAQDYEAQAFKNALNPLWGLYVSAHSRRNLLSQVYQLELVGQQVIYCDTDSIKIYKYNEKGAEVINKYNQDIQQRLTPRLKKYNCDLELCNDLGMWDLEYNHVLKFITLGAKRYLITYEKDGKIKDNQTVAGLPKNYLFNKYERDDVYNMFDDDLVVKDCKLRSTYTDEPYTLTVNGVDQFEYSGVALCNTDFSMSLDDDWIEYLKEMLNSSCEFRLY